MICMGVNDKNRHTFHTYFLGQDIMYFTYLFIIIIVEIIIMMDFNIILCVFQRESTNISKLALI